MLKREGLTIDVVNGCCFKDFYTDEGWRTCLGTEGLQGSWPWCMCVVSCKEHIAEILSHVPFCAL